MKARSARRILVISAGFDHQANEFSTVWQHIADTCDVDICVIAPGLDHLKGQQSATGSKQFGRLTVHWLAQPFPLTASDAVRKIAAAFQPDTIFTGPRDQLACALDLAQASGARVALHIEYFFADHHWLRRREYFGLTPLRRLVGNRVRRQVLDQVHRVFVSDPAEQAAFNHHPCLRYLPWPHRPPVPDRDHQSAGAPLVPQADRNTSELLYIGSLFRAKGVGRLADYLIAAARRFPELRLRIVGPVIDRDGAAALERIRTAIGDRLDWTQSLPRSEALALLGRSFCAISPGESHGWGQIGDAWHLRTPVIAARQHYELQANSNCLIAADADAFVAAVAQLRSDIALRERLADAGQASVANHAVQRTVAALMDGLDIAARPSFEPLQDRDTQEGVAVAREISPAL